MATKKASAQLEQPVDEVVAADPLPVRRKDFGNAVRFDQLPPLEFDLCGRTFRCIPAMQSRRLMEFVKRAEGGDGGSASDLVHEFLETCIISDDLASWNELMDSDEYVIDVQLISDIVGWLITQYSSRPT